MLTSMLISGVPPFLSDATHVYVPKSVNLRSMMSRLVVPGETSVSVWVMTIRSELLSGRPFFNQLNCSSSGGVASTWQLIFTSRPIWMLSSLWYGSGVIQNRPLRRPAGERWTGRQILFSKRFMFVLKVKNLIRKEETKLTKPSWKVKSSLNQHLI